MTHAKMTRDSFHVQRADADGIPGGNEPVPLPVVEHQGKLCVQHLEHVQAMLPVEGQEDLAIRPAVEHIALLLQGFLQGAEPVQLPVAHHRDPAQDEGLHPCLLQAHNGQPVEEQVPRGGLQGPGHIRSPGFGLLKAQLQLLQENVLTRVPHNGTHKKAPPNVLRSAS